MPHPRLHHHHVVLYATADIVLHWKFVEETTLNHLDRHRTPMGDDVTGPDSYAIFKLDNVHDGK